MIPLKDENPSKTTPFVNYFLILSNLAAFIYLKYFIQEDPQQVFSQLGFIPYEISHLKDVSPKNLVPIPLTVLTSMFIHGGWIHLMSNILYLWVFGDNIEDRLGHARYMLFYLLCGILANLVHGIVNMNSSIPSVGASGAIAGILGAYLLLFPKARIKTLFIVFVFAKIIRLPALLVLGFLVTFQILSGFAEYRIHDTGGIAWFAHIGGFVSGLTLVNSFKKRGGRFSGE